MQLSGISIKPMGLEFEKTGFDSFLTLYHKKSAKNFKEKLLADLIMVNYSLTIIFLVITCLLSNFIFTRYTPDGTDK